jgi:Cu2+-exporting ATPase
MISGAGLGRYYQFRQALGRKISTDVAAQKKAWQAIDERPMLWGTPASDRDHDGRYELQLQTEGIRCAACAWLIRSQLESAPGIHAVQVDTATGFTRITWSPAITRLSAIAACLFELGYVPHLPIASAEEEGRRHERRESLKRVAVAGLGMMQVMMFAVAQYSGQASGFASSPASASPVGHAPGMSPASFGFLSLVSLLVTFPVVLYSGRVFFSGAWAGLKAGRPGMDVPVALAIGLAFIASCYNFFSGAGQVWFDSVVMFIFFLIVGRHLELVLRHRNVQAGTALARLLPEWALRITQGAAETVPATDLAVGDLARVVPGTAFPADGIIHCGSTQVDEALLTGESNPGPKGPGDRVIAGTLNLAQSVDMEITAAGRDSTLSALARMVLSAQVRKSGDAGLPGWLVPVFVIAVLLLASGTWIYWQWVQPGVAFPAALAVLVASCPCALALALPAVHSAASHRLLLEGILLTRTDALHDLLKVDCVIFDKTGTLTEGRARVRRADLNPRRPDCAEAVALGRAAALEAHSSHPLARAFRHLPIEPAASGVVSHPSGGLHGYVDGHQWAIGNARFVQGMTPGMESQGDSSDIWLADEHDWYARFQIEDGLRRDAARAVAAVKADGMDVYIFSGDSEAAVAFAARELNIGECRSRQSAADKLNGIRSLQQQGHTVLMVGDGANDAPVLAAANVSMTVQGATELANSTADFILTSPSLLALGRAFEISRMAARLIRQNLAWALAYNTAILPLAMSGMLQPWMAAVGMSSSSLLVVLNATRIARFRRQATPVFSGKNA